MTDATFPNAGTGNVLPVTFSATQVAESLGATENFVLRNYAAAGVRPLRSSRKQPRFTRGDVDQLIEWMRNRGKRGEPDPKTVTSRRSAARAKGKAA
jgi:hypothetical protein